MPTVERTHVNERDLERLLGFDSSKIGFYSDVKQKIGELEAANLDLRAKKNELQAVFDAIHDGVLIFGPDCRIRYRNHICPGLFPERTLLGKSCQELFHPEQARAPATCPVETALRGGRLGAAFSESEGGRTRHFEITATPIHDPLNRPSKALVFIRDVTERREQELQLLQAEKMSNIGVLAAGVAHELNNPLTSVALYAEALRRRLAESDAAAEDSALAEFPEYLDVIVRESHRCNTIIQSLLSFSRKSDGVLGAVDLPDIVQEVLQLVRHRAEEEHVRVRTDFTPGLPRVLGDAAGLRQVVLNLALNGIQAIAGEGEIEIRGGLSNGRILLQVQDTGQGIPEALLDQIWTPFFTTKPVGQGLGLGLSVVYNIVDKHQGEILVESELGRGSTFTVLFRPYEAA